MFGSQFQDTLCEAVRNRLVVEIRYDDDRSYRQFEPHIVYRSTQDNVLVGGTQTHNPEKPQEQDAPRNFDLDKIRDVKITDRTFTPHHLFNRLSIAA
jgi:predicted DNA-binding transcriptional regulator YafY